MAKKPQETIVQLIDIGTIDNARQVYFQSPRMTGEVYTWPPMHYNARYERAKRFPDQLVENLSGMYIDDTCGDWFFFYEMDCFYPPIYAIRASSFESAYEVFLDEFATVIDDPATLKDYESDESMSECLYHTSRGPVDTESVNGCEASICYVEV